MITKIKILTLEKKTTNKDTNYVNPLSIGNIEDPHLDHKIIATGVTCGPARRQLRFTKSLSHIGGILSNGNFTLTNDEETNYSEIQFNGILQSQSYIRINPLTQNISIADVNEEVFGSMNKATDSVLRIYDEISFINICEADYKLLGYKFGDGTICVNTYRTRIDGTSTRYGGCIILTKSSKNESIPVTLIMKDLETNKIFYWTIASNENNVLFVKSKTLVKDKRMLENYKNIDKSKFSKKIRLNTQTVLTDNPTTVWLTRDFNSLPDSVRESESNIIVSLAIPDEELKTIDHIKLASVIKKSIDDTVCHNRIGIPRYMTCTSFTFTSDIHLSNRVLNSLRNYYYIFRYDKENEKFINVKSV